MLFLGEQNTGAVLTYTRTRVNRKESGPRAGPDRPCLRRESRAVTLREVPAKPQAKWRPGSLCWARRGRTGPHQLLPSTQAAKEQDKDQRGASSACPHKHRDRHGLAEVENTDTSRSVGTGSSPGCQGTTAQQHAERAGSQSGLSPGSQGAATTALCLSEQTGHSPGAGHSQAADSWDTALLTGARLTPHTALHTSVLPCPRSKGTGPAPGIPTCGCIPPERGQAEIRPLLSHP